MTTGVVSYIELGYTGHQAVMLRATAEAFLSSPVEGVTLSCWMSRHLLEDDPALASDFGGPTAKGRIRLNYLEEASTAAAGTSLAPLTRVIACLEQDRACGCFLPYLDPFMTGIACLQPGFLRTRLSGTLFRPMLHYATFPNHRGRNWPPGARSRLCSYLITLAVARRRFVAEVLTLDGLAPVFYNRVTATMKFRHLPDYVVPRSEPPYSRQELGLPADRIIFLLAGGISNYKGVREFIVAVRLACAESESFRRRACVVLAGRVLESRELVYQALAELAEQYPQVPVQLCDRRLTDREFLSFVSVADVVCVPYIWFAGTSSLLVHAAAHGHLVIGPKYGLMGELIRRHRLGVCCDPTVPTTLRDAMCALVNGDTHVDAQQAEAMSAFVAEQSSLADFGHNVRKAVLRTAGICA